MHTSVCIIYGFSEGVWQTKRFRQVLVQRGYSIVDDPTQANVIITHSGGAFTVPPLRQHQSLVLINPPYWPGRPLRVRAYHMTLQLLHAIRPGNRPGYHIVKTAHNITYLMLHPRTNAVMARRAEQYDLIQGTSHRNTLLIRNRHDPWLTPDLEPVLAANARLKFAELPGEHDDCWLNPEPYVHLLQSEL